MTDKYYQKNVFYRGLDKFIGFMKAIPQSQANAIWIAVAFFVILIAFMEYRVFESTLSITGDVVLAGSVLFVTAVGGIIAEMFLHRNKKATDDQLMAANWLFGISLVASAIAGFGVWAQTSGNETINLFNRYAVTLPQFADFVFVMITAVTVIDVFILRWYIREDVDMKHTRNVERVESRRRTAELETDESLIEFDAELERKVKKTLKIETKRKQVKEELTKMYGGNVPADILRKAMNALDGIQRSDDYADDDNDGVRNREDTTYNPKSNNRSASTPPAPDAQTGQGALQWYTFEQFCQQIGLSPSEARAMVANCPNHDEAFKKLVIDRNMSDKTDITGKNFRKVYYRDINPTNAATANNNGRR